jgi:hypothetical protein
MDLNFEIFMIVLVVLAIVVVGNFLRDGETNWLEGALLVVSGKALNSRTAYEWLTGFFGIDRLRDHRDCILVLPESGRGDFE